MVSPVTRWSIKEKDGATTDCETLINHHPSSLLGISLPRDTTVSGRSSSEAERVGSLYTSLSFQ